MRAIDALRLVGGGDAGTVSTSFDVTIQTSGVDDTFTLPTKAGYTYSANVDWGDESNSEITAFDDADITHTYAVEGAYTIKITGTFEAWSFNNSGDKLMVTAVHFGSGVLFKYLTDGFYGCTNLATLTGNIGDDNISSLSRCFRHCSTLSSIPSGLFDNNTSVASFPSCFSECSTLSSIPSGLFDNNTSVTDFTSCFRLTNISSIPSGLFDNNTSVAYFVVCFSGCTSLTSIPIGLFNNNNVVTSFGSCFSGCTNLTVSSRELWLNPSGAGNYTLTSPDYDTGVPIGGDCYRDCTNLTDYATIPTYWK